MRKAIIVIILLFITGCTKYTDLNNISIIKSIGISYDKEYTLYAEIYTEIKKDNEPKTKIIKVIDKEVNKLFEKIKKESNKELFFSHIDLLILDSNLLNDNYLEIINYFLNNSDLRNDFSCIFSNNVENVLNNSKYNEIENYLKANKESKKIINVTFNELIENYLNNKPVVLSLINYDDKLEFDGNYMYYHNHFERIYNEKN